MQRATLTATSFGLALAARTLRASTADHGALAALQGPPSWEDALQYLDDADLAAIADYLELNQLAQGGWDAEEEAMLAEMVLAEYEWGMEPTELAQQAASYDVKSYKESEYSTKEKKGYYWHYGTYY